MPKKIRETKEELLAQLKEKDKKLINAGIERPNNLLNQIEKIEEEYRARLVEIITKANEELERLREECAERTGRPLSKTPKKGKSEEEKRAFYFWAYDAPTSFRGFDKARDHFADTASYIANISGCQS